MYQSDFIPGFVELSSIGTVACNNHWYDVCIQWLDTALKLESSNIDWDPVFKTEIQTNFKKAIEAHDKYLETRGPVSQHRRCFANLPLATLP